jgi:hypothetical protein
LKKIKIKKKKKKNNKVENSAKNQSETIESGESEEIIEPLKLNEVSERLSQILSIKAGSVPEELLNDSDESDDEEPAREPRGTRLLSLNSLTKPIIEVFFFLFFFFSFSFFLSNKK